MGDVKLLTTNNSGKTFVRIEGELTYVLVMESISQEETERIWDEMTDMAELHYLWWEDRKIGIIFQTESEPNYDKLEKYVKKDVHCPYLVVSQYIDPTEKTDAPVPVPVLDGLRTSVYFTKDKNLLISSNSSDMFTGHLKN